MTDDPRANMAAAIFMAAFLVFATTLYIIDLISTKGEHHEK